jgi:hypothetical protein
VASEWRGIGKLSGDIEGLEIEEVLAGDEVSGGRIPGPFYSWLPKI